MLPNNKSPNLADAAKSGQIKSGQIWPPD